MAMLGRELGMTVVAEGVETAAQQAAVEAAAVDAVQGYFHARPMPEEAMLAWLKERKTHEP
jgi:EAL domain-containing protein (putative c-di-GMP-specific phosphodiesterase class I)